MKLIQPRPFHPWKTLSVTGVLLAVLISLSLRDRPADTPIAWSGATMGTTYTIKLAQARLSAQALAALQQEVAATLDEVNRQMSHYRPDSELSQFNRAPAGIPFQISPEFAQVVRYSLDLNGASRGAFDPTLGPLIDLWGFGPAPRSQALPTADEIAAAARLTGCRHLSITDDGKLIKDIPELRLNLSAVAKGFGVDEVARVIRSHGWTNYFVEIGGEVATSGLNAEGQKWRVGIDLPEPGHAPGEELASILHLSGEAVASSGDYRTYREKPDGQRASHLLDPRTGKPVEHTLAGVTVVAENCMTADALATTLFVMGPEEGRAWINQVPRAHALFLIHQPDGTFTHITSAEFEQWMPPSHP